MAQKKTVVALLFLQAVPKPEEPTDLWLVLPALVVRWMRAAHRAHRHPAMVSSWQVSSGSADGIRLLTEETGRLPGRLSHDARRHWQRTH